MPPLTPPLTQVTHKKTSARPVMPNQALDTPTQVYKGPVTHNHAKLLQQEVHTFLSGLHPNIDENYILPEYMSPNVTQVYTRGYTTGLHEGRRGLRHGHKGCFPS